MSSKIEQIIDEIEDFIDGCKFQAFSSTNILVDKEHIEELLRELRMKTPDEIKRYQKIISNKEAILNDAKEKAEAMINEAQIHTDHMVNEHEIMQQAYAQANEVVQQAVSQAQQILDTATSDANDIRQSAMKYTDDMLAVVQGILKTAISDAESKYSGLIERLKSSAATVDKNRADLYPQVELEKEIASIEGINLPKPDTGSNGSGINLDMLSK
ncbi:MAG: vacuolar family H+-ATPase subunit H [Lachnospiraceae bacterium]|nr:vacuolar family H+-ATPase subunit H [Lachnospiraceae bacterium]